MDEWILCSERMPEEHDSIWSKHYGTEYFKKSMWKTESDEVIVTVKYSDGTREVATSHTNDGKWRIEKERIVPCKVVAWMPLPLPCIK